MMRKIRDLVKKSIRIDRHRKAGATIDYDPKSLLTQRPRALTLTSHTEDISGFLPSQATVDQSSSFLFKLPRELRNMIYVYAVGGSRLHIGRQLQRLSHVKCIVPSTMFRDTHLHKCWGPPYPPDVDGLYMDGSRDGGLLSLLKTCRLM